MNDKLLKLVELGQIPWEDFKKMLTDYNTAFAKCQKEIPVIKKDVNNGRFNYAPYEDIREQTKNIIADNGLSFKQWPIKQDGSYFLISLLKHTSGYEEEMIAPIVVSDANPGRLTNEQRLGCAITYTKRYTYCTIFGIATYEADPDESVLHETGDEERCPKCNKILQLRTGAKGNFLACPGYPSCKFTKSVGE